LRIPRYQIDLHFCPAAETGRDGFFGCGVLLPDARWCGLHGVGRLEGLDLFGDVGNARSFFIFRQMG
jgi:hypothetical protein